jgi:hypothetical protein
MKWMAVDVKKNIRERRKAERSYQKRPTMENLLIYKKSKAETRRLLKKTRRETWKEYVSTITEKTSSKTVWDKVGQISGKRRAQDIRYLVTENGTRVGDPSKMADELARGGLISKSLCGIPYKKFFKFPQRPLFLTFCMGDYKSLAAIAALPQWPVRPWNWPRSLQKLETTHSTHNSFEGKRPKKERNRYK